MKILVAGNICPIRRVAELFESEDFQYVLGNVKLFIEKADYSIVNFESPVCNAGEQPVEKCGPNHKCSEKCIKTVRWAGFDGVTLANDHFLNYGKEGGEHTLSVCRENSLHTVGGGEDLKEASKILYKVVNGRILDIINCCEHEFSLATGSSDGSTPLIPTRQYYAMQKANYALVIGHGGHEHYQLPSNRMQETYLFFVDTRTDVVVNHQQHCYSGYEVYYGGTYYFK